jgi:hypothetical protein
MHYQGSCHCGNVEFTVEGELKEAMACNCSMCQRKGSMLWFVPYSHFSLRTPEEAMTTYHFNRHAIDHKFCKSCGIHAFAVGSDPQGNKMAAINIRSLENFDIDSVAVTHFDGRSK